jgi:hypothetical protein
MKAAVYPGYGKPVVIEDLPDPVPGQTVEDVMRAEAEFVRKVAELHPESRGKPAVIGNCQPSGIVSFTFSNASKRLSSVSKA